MSDSREAVSVDEQPDPEVEEEQMSSEHKELARDMFEKITEYLNGELAGGLSCAY